ncbi:MAG TPA: molybdopterin-guanine dinucleotide biosynthesis protein B [Gemmatimonadaceae bacterium]|nr:molybdopterin-guanine dinucleotide biosynthesis protein B [Gemmatimonadaceae bacterium]
MPRPPMVAIVGGKHHGKTTLVVRLAAELRRRGRRVMIIKHGSHTFNIDPATTDTWRHYHEGMAEKVAMVSPDKFALVERWSEERSPEEIAERHMADADIVLCEGFKRSSLPRIEIFRGEAGGTPLYDPASPAAAHYLAVLTDLPSLPGDVPVIHLSDPAWLATLADLVERHATEGAR